MPNTDLQLYSRSDVENARTKGQLVGWIQGAGGMLLLGVALSAMGWIPTLLIAGAVVFVGYKVFGR